MKPANYNSLRFIVYLLPGGPGLAQSDLISAVEIAFGQNAIDRSPFEGLFRCHALLRAQDFSAWIARSNAIIKAWPDRQKRSVAADRL